MVAKKHAVIVAHPNPDSFTLSVARAYQETVTGFGHPCVMRDLYRLNFDPKLADSEIPRPAGFAPGGDVKAERDAIGEADVFVFAYPLWFYMPPAAIIGYVQRVFGMGFGYGPIRQGGNQPLLRPKSMITFSSSGSPKEWLQTEGAWEAVKAIFDQHLAEVCGLSVLTHRHFGRVLNATPKVRIEAHLQEVRQVATQYFAPPKAPD